jgi:hypothetical protein
MSTMIDSTAPSSVNADLRNLFAAGERGAGRLLVAWYELAERYRTDIAAAMAPEESAREEVRIEARLRAALPAAKLDVWPEVPRFLNAARALARGGAHHGLDAGLLTIRAGLGALDTFVGECAIAVPASRITSPLSSGAGYWVVPVSPWRQPGWRQAAGGFSQRRSGLSPLDWLRHVRCIPCRKEGASFRLAQLPAELDSLLPAAVPGEGAGIAIGVSALGRSMRHRFALRGTRTIGGETFSVFRLSGQEATGPAGSPVTGDPLAPLVHQLRERILPACDEKQVAVLLLPELTVSPELRERLADLLRERERQHAAKFPGRRRNPVLVVAGSYHEARTDGFANRTTILDYRGDPVDLEAVAGGDLVETWMHDKVEEYVVRGSDLSDPEWRKGLDLDRQGIVGGVEPEAPGTMFTIVQSRLGKICIAICIDYLQHAEHLFDPIQGAWVDWVWVPSASVNLGLYRHKASSLARHGAGSVVVNACWLVSSLGAHQKAPWTGLAHLPGDQGAWESSDGGRAKGRTVPSQACGESCPHDCFFVFRVS